MSERAPSPVQASLVCALITVRCSHRLPISRIIANIVDLSETKHNERNLFNDCHERIRYSNQQRLTVINIAPASSSSSAQLNLLAMCFCRVFYESQQTLENSIVSPRIILQEVQETNITHSNSTGRYTNPENCSGSYSVFSSPDPMARAFRFVC